MILPRKKTSLVLWLTTIVLMSVLLFSHAYGDILVTARQSINLWKNLFDGDILRFYELNVVPSGNVFYTHPYMCFYNFLLYLVFAVWNIPLALLEGLAHVDVMNSIPCIVWIKLLPAAAMLASAWVLYRILVLLGVPERGRGMLSYLYLSSALMISVIFIIGQYDVIGLIFQLLGVYAFLKGDRRRFVFYFGISFCFKYFSLLIFLPLLVLMEKRIVTYIKYLFGMVLPLIVTKLPFMLVSSIGGGESSTAGDMAFLIRMMFEYSLSFVNLFVVVYMLILVWCYLHGSEDKIHAEGIWACFVSYAAFFGLCRLYPYWSILLAPFVILVIAVTPKRLYLNLLLETVGLSAIVLFNMEQYSHCYFGATMYPMLAYRLFPNPEAYNGLIQRIFSPDSGLIPSPVVSSLYIGAMVAMAWVTYPKTAPLSLAQWSEPEDCRDILFLRALAVALLCLLPILSLFI